MILIISVRLQISLKPYKSEENNHAEFLAIISGVVTIISGFVYIRDDQVDSLNYIVLVAVLFLNAFFILKWLSLLLGNYEDKSKALKSVSLKLLIDLDCEFLKFHYMT